MARKIPFRAWLQIKNIWCVFWIPTARLRSANDLCYLHFDELFKEENANILQRARSGKELQLQSDDEERNILWHIIFCMKHTTVLCVTILFVFCWSQVLLNAIWSTSRWRRIGAGSCPFLNSSSTCYTAFSPARPFRVTTRYGLIKENPTDD